MLKNGDIPGRHEDRCPASDQSAAQPACASGDQLSAGTGSVTDWMALGVGTAPDSPALRFRDAVLSHREFDAYTNRLANALIQEGIGPGDRIGLCLDRSIEMVAGVVGILKAGAVYVPLDPGYPPDRLAMMLHDAEVRLLLVHLQHADRFTRASCKIALWDEFSMQVESAADSAPAAAIDPENEAYIIFTSGSTGRPKGVSMPHRALSNLIEWQLQRKSFRPGARVLQYSSISFDVSFQEIATTLASGGMLCLIPDEDRRDPRRLLAHLIDHRIERLFLPYVAMRSMIEAAHVIERYPADLKEVITAGEQLRVDDSVRRFFDRVSGSSLDNQYGPSETHVITAHLLEGDTSVWPDLPPIGMPVSNCCACILNDAMKPVEQGVVGELYLGGRNLAHGYVNRDDITREVFVANPLDDPDFPVLYRTGDLASCKADGSLIFHGRKDHQIKIRGHRIEPGEINNSAAAFAGIAHCLTHAARSHDGILQLITYFTVKEGAQVDPESLRAHLAARLPEYMVPAFIVKLDEIPYTPSGKVDHKALPAPSIQNSRYADEDCTYESETERMLAGLWGQLLGLERIPRLADFFELGGDSLRAVTLFLRIQQQFGMELPLSTLAHTATIAGIAGLIDGVGDVPDLSGYRALQVLRKGVDGEIPLFLFHGGKGNVLVFSRFAQGLDSRQPVYAFQWSGWDGGPGERTIPAMARLYASEIRRFMQGAVCRLGGNCIGGLIAIEVAQLLSEQGVSIDGPLLVWDAPNLGSPHYHPREPWGNAQEMEALERLKTTLLEHTPEHLRGPIAAAPEACSAGLIGVLQRLPFLRRIVQWSKIQCRSVPVYMARVTGRKVPMELREYHCLRTMLTAVHRYVAKPYDGDILYFRSHSVIGRDFSIPGWWDDLYLGFDELCGGHFEAHVVGQQHNRIADVPEITEIVRQCYGSNRNKEE